MRPFIQLTWTPRSVRPAILLLAAPLLVGCPNTDTAVFVAPSLESPTVAIDTSSPLVTTVSGSFTLKLHLGARASGPSQVDLGQFDVEDYDRQGAIITPLSLTAKGGQQFPVTVEPDSDVTVPFEFDLGQKTLPKDDPAIQKLCDTRGVFIAGMIKDSLQDTDTPVQAAEAVHATGCP